MYSNPIGSLIREITSNCFDSHIEAKVEEPVRLAMVWDSDEGYHMEFEDFGVGISPDRMKKIYSKYFSSTKVFVLVLHFLKTFLSEVGGYQTSGQVSSVSQNFIEH